MPEHVTHLFKLVENEGIGTRPAKLPDLVENFLNVALAAGRREDLIRDVREPVKALLAHVLGQDRDRLTTEQLRVECASAAVVTGRRPYRPVVVRVKLTGDETGNETAVRSADLVTSGREPFADDDEDTRVNTAQLARDLDIVHISVAGSFKCRLILPCDAEQIQRVDIP